MLHLGASVKEEVTVSQSQVTNTCSERQTVGCQRQSKSDTKKARKEKT